MSFNPATIDPFNLPSLPLAERYGMPNSSGLYFALTTGGEVLYIGRAQSLKERWLRHHRLSQLEMVPNIRIAWAVLDAPLHEVERQLIRRFNPALNDTPKVVPPSVEPRELLMMKARAAQARLIAFHKALFKCNPPGADLLFEDYQGFHESLKAREAVKVVSKEDAVAEALHAIAEFVSGEERDFETKAANAIRAIRFLMAVKKR